MAPLHQRVLEKHNPFPVADGAGHRSDAPVILEIPRR